MSDSSSGAWAMVGIPAIILGIVAAGAAWPPPSTADPASAAQAQRAERTTVCPSLRQTPDGLEAVTTFVDPDSAWTAAGAAAPAHAPGSITAGGAGAIPLPAPGEAVRVDPPQAGQSVTVRATGAAAGLSGTVREYYDSGDEGRGLALASCVEPRAQWWFVGVSAKQGQVDELLLANPTQSPAVVDIDIYGPAGPIQTVGVSGAVVQPGEQSVIRVDSLIPGTTSATMRVTTRGGVVAAALRSTIIDGLIPLGAEFLPAAAEPALRAVVPAVLPGSGPRELAVTAPDGAAEVQFQYVTAVGVRERSAAGPISVPAGHTVMVALEQDLAGSASAVVIDATAPVTAAARSTHVGVIDPAATGVLHRLAVADFAWTAASQEIVHRWQLPLSGAGQAPGIVLLTSLGAPATVKVTTRAASGAMSQQSVDVPQDTTVTVAAPVTPLLASLVTIERRSGAGQLFAGVAQIGSIAGAPLAASATGMDPAAEVDLPPAHPDPRVMGED